MDYKYIEQLLERYWNCETSQEEEEILRSFFAQKDVPVRLLPYRDLFLVQGESAEEHLDADFDKRILALTEDKDKKEPAHGHRVAAGKVKRIYTLRPFFHAAACVAIVLCLGMAVQQASLHGERSNEVIKSGPDQLSPWTTPSAYGELETLPAVSADTVMQSKNKESHL